MDFNEFRAYFPNVRSVQEMLQEQQQRDEAVRAFYTEAFDEYVKLATVWINTLKACFHQLEHLKDSLRRESGGSLHEVETMAKLVGRAMKSIKAPPRAVIP